MQKPLKDTISIFIKMGHSKPPKERKVRASLILVYKLERLFIGVQKLVSYWCFTQDHRCENQNPSGWTWVRTRVPIP